MSGPLEGIRVFDLTIAAVGPWSTMLLGALGADVIKVEAPAGDMIRGVPPPQRGMGSVYIHCNYNKRGTILDLKRDRDRDAALALVKTCDVFVENMRPGAVDRLGMGYEAVSKLNPRIIYISANAYGSEGPMGGRGGVDPTVQAFCGWCGLNGVPGGEPEVFRHYAHLDLNTASYIVSAVLQALLAREKTGRGQKIDLTMMAAALALQTTRLSEYFAGMKPRPMGSACQTTVPHQAFLCQDKDYIAVGVVAEDQWSRLCAGLGLNELVDDQRFCTNARRVENREELIPLLERVFIAKPTAWWLKVLTRHRVPHGRVMDFEGLRYHPSIVENEYLIQMDGHWGKIHAAGLPWKFSKTPATMRPGPAPGEHTKEVLRELGIDPKAVVAQTDRA